MSRFLVIAVLVACGSSKSSPQVDAANGVVVDGARDAPIDTRPADAEVLMAPFFETLKPNLGGLRLTWTNMTPDCDVVEVWRKDGLDPYAIVGMPAGTEVAYADATATSNFNYTYRLRCKKGTAVSDYSAEQSANPQM